MKKPKKRNSKEANRKALLKTGAAAFAKTGLGGARVAEIAVEAGMAVGTFYLYFKDKEDLFNEVLRNGAEIAIHRLTKVESGDTKLSDFERNKKAMARMLSYAEENKDMFRLMLSRSGSDNPLQRTVLDIISQVRVKQLAEGQKSGRFAKEINPLATAIGEVGFVFHLLDYWLDNQDEFSRDQIVDTLVRVRMYGVESRKG